MKNKKIPGIIAAILFGAILNLNAQYALQVTHDTTICAGQSVQLNVSGGTTYTWSPSGTLNSSTSASPVATPAQTTSYVVSSTVSASNMAVNGDFSAGNIGFSTQYHYEEYYDTLGPGDYTVGNSPSTWNTGYSNLCSTYMGAANMLIADGSLNADVPIWCETFHVYPNSTYNLSAYFESLDETNLPKLQWMVNDTAKGSSTSSYLECTWNHATATWNSGTDTSATFCIFSTITGQAEGDDIALDNITITGTLTLTDTVVVTVVAPPVVNIGNDTSLCTGQMLTLNATAGNSTYLWSTGATTPTISVNSAGTYKVQVNNGCTVKDSIVVSYTSPPTAFSLGNDTTYCGSFSRVLTTGNANTLWSTSANGAQITVNSPGTYWATETNQCGTKSDTIIIGQAPAPIVSLGADTAICSAQTVLLDAGNPGSTYNWSNNTHNDTITTSLPGTYSVTVTNIAGCSSADTIVISSYSVPLSVTSVNTSCGISNGTAIAVITNGRGPYNYIWNDNNDTTAGISGLIAGSYIVTVTDANGCTATATADIMSSGANSVSVTASDTLICPNDTAQLCATPGFAAYSWSNGDTSLCIHTQLANSYSVTVTDGGNCTASSGITSIQVRQPPSVTVSVSGDTLTSYSASSYQWYLNDTLIAGATANTYIAPVSGNYTVVISDSHGCTATSSPVPVIVSGISNILNDTNIKVYPNPLEDGKWMLQVDKTALGGNIELFDDNGRIVYRAIITSILMPLDLNAASGIYLLRVAVNDQYYTTKLIKL